MHVFLLSMPFLTNNIVFLQLYDNLDFIPQIVWTEIDWQRCNKIKRHQNQRHQTLPNMTKFSFGVHHVLAD